MKHLVWAARIAPYIDQDAAWARTQEAYQADPVFWKPAHDDIRGSVIPVYICPADDRTKLPSPWGGRMHGQLSYLGVAGTSTTWQDGVYYADSKTRSSDISNGASNTLALGERPPSDDFRFGWWYAGLGQQQDGAGDSVLGVRDCCRRPSYCEQCEEPAYHFEKDRVINRCAFLHFWSLHPRGGHFAFADGSVRFLHYTSDSVLPMLATRAGGESLPEFE